MLWIWNWTSRLLLLLSLAVLCKILVIVWPDGRRRESLTAIASVAALLVAICGVALWTIGSWIGESHLTYRRSHQRADSKKPDKSEGVVRPAAAAQATETLDIAEKARPRRRLQVDTADL
jgi:hypothetical protein